MQRDREDIQQYARHAVTAVELAIRVGNARTHHKKRQHERRQLRDLGLDHHSIHRIMTRRAAQQRARRGTP